MTNTWSKGLKAFRQNSGLRVASIKFVEEVLIGMFHMGNPLYTKELSNVIVKAAKTNLDREFDPESLQALTIAFALRVGRVGDDDIFELASGIMALVKVLDMAHSHGKPTIPPEKSC